MARRSMPKRKDVNIKEELQEDQEEVLETQEVVELNNDALFLPKPKVMRIVNCKSLNVRLEPTKESPILFTIPSFYKLLVSFYKADWAYVTKTEDSSKSGYVLRKYLRE